MNKEQLIELIERNPSINKRTSSDTIKEINRFHKEVFNKPVKDTGCHGCVLEGLDKLRRYMGYEPIKKKESKNIIKKRLETCYNCPHMVKNGLLGLFDQCGVCKCSITLKTELRPKMIKLLGGCPDNRWDT